MTETESDNILEILVRQVSESYDLEGLHGLANEMNIDWEEIAGESKESRINSLLILLGENNRMDELADILNRDQSTQANSEFPDQDQPSTDRAQPQPEFPSRPFTSVADRGVSVVGNVAGNVITGDDNVIVYGNQNVYSVTQKDSPESLKPQEYRSRQNFLSNIKAIWIDGVLYQSLYSSIILSLNKSYATTAITRSTRLTHLLTDEHVPIEAQKPIIELFEENGRKLLILGAPGSGKTTTLLQLASELVTKAEEDNEVPIPVLLNLATWNLSWRSLREWLVEEIFLQYQLARNLSEDWLIKNQFILLLDGLDEVPTEDQNMCVQTINAFLSDTGSEMVICCRTEEYHQLSGKLNLGNAIQLQPLSREQVNEYLVEHDPNLGALREILPHDEQLQQLAASPLMLNIMTLAYQGVDTSALKPDGTVDKRRKHLFDYYVASMFKRKSESGSYSKNMAITWLTNVADHMCDNNLASFHLDTIQPDWIPQRRDKLLYWLLAAVMAGIVVGMGVGLISFLSSTLLLSLQYEFTGALSAALGLGIKDGIIFGLCTACGVFTGSIVYHTLSIPNWLKFALTIVAAALMGGLAGGVLGASFYNIPSGFTLGFVSGLIAGLLAALFATRSKITLVESLKLTMPNGSELAHNTLIFGLTGFIIGGLVSFALYVIQLLGIVSGYGLASFTTSVLFYGVVGMIVGFVISVWRPKDITEHPQPNQRIYNSLFNAIKVTVLVGLITFAFAWIVRLGFLNFNAILRNYILYFLVISSFFYFGGVSVIQHYALRLTLAINKTLPYPLQDKNLVAYLDDMADHVFLQRTGGGWIFIHRTLLEYFCQLSPSPESDMG